MSRLARWSEGLALQLAASSSTLHHLCDWLLLSWEAAMSALPSEVAAAGSKPAGQAGGSSELVGSAMSLFLVVRHGLSGADLADMLSIPPLLVWRFLYVLGGESGGILEQHDGRYHLASRAMREAATRAYMIQPPAAWDPAASSSLEAAARDATGQPRQPLSAAASISAAAERVQALQGVAEPGGGEKQVRHGGGEVWARLAIIHCLGNPVPRNDRGLVRIAGEVPSQLKALQCLTLLRDLICSMPVFFALWSHPQGVADMITYWRQDCLGAHFSPAHELVAHLNAFIAKSHPLALYSGRHAHDAAGVDSSQKTPGATSSCIPAEAPLPRAESAGRDALARDVQGDGERAARMGEAKKAATDPTGNATSVAAGTPEPPQHYAQWAQEEGLLVHGVVVESATMAGEGSVSWKGFSGTGRDLLRSASLSDRSLPAGERLLSGGDVLEHIAAVARFLHLLLFITPAEAQYARAARLSHALYGQGHRRTVTALREHASSLFDLHFFDSALNVVNLGLTACGKMPPLVIKVAPLQLHLATSQQGSASHKAMQAGPAQVREVEYGQDADEMEAGDEGPLFVEIGGLETEDASACLELRARVLRAAGQYHEAVESFRRSAALNQLHMYRRTVAAIQRARAKATGLPHYAPEEDDEGEVAGTGQQEVEEWGRLDASAAPRRDPGLSKVRARCSPSAPIH